MDQPPAELSDGHVLDLVRSEWMPEIERVDYLAVGFGAYHWRGDRSGVPTWFVTYDRCGRHTVSSLAAAYAAAGELAKRGLEFVLAPVPARSGEVVVPVADGALSCTPWVTGGVVGDGPLTDAATAADNIATLGRLHSSAPPNGLPQWQPAVGPTFGAELRERLVEPWDTGPYGESARSAITSRLIDIDDWTDRYIWLSTVAVNRPWVPTHGETHTGNQVRTETGIVFVDWESLMTAPRERDLSTLVQAGYGTRVGAEPTMVELFDLEWRLSEIDSYAAWFAACHTGTTDDRVAYEGLRSELSRGPWWQS